MVRSVKAPVAAPALEKLRLATRLFEDGAEKNAKVAQLLVRLRNSLTVSPVVDVLFLAYAP